MNSPCGVSVFSAGLSTNSTATPFFLSCSTSERRSVVERARRSGDFTRNAFISVFVSPSLAKNGDISAIVPMVSHHDHTEHDVQVIITEQGLADLRGLSPKQRAKVVIENCAHPDFRDQLWEYVARAEAVANSEHTPHDLSQAHSWHRRFLETGSMKQA